MKKRFTTSKFNSSDETHMVQIHPNKIAKSGNIYIHRYKVRWFGTDITRTHSFNVKSIKYYKSTASSALNGKYYYFVATVNEDAKDSGADVVLNQAYVKETTVD